MVRGPSALREAGRGHPDAGPGLRAGRPGSASSAPTPIEVPTIRIERSGRRRRRPRRGRGRPRGGRLRLGRCSPRRTASSALFAALPDTRAGAGERRRHRTGHRRRPAPLAASSPTSCPSPLRRRGSARRVPRRCSGWGPCAPRPGRRRPRRAARRSRRQGVGRRRRRGLPHGAGRHPTPISSSGSRAPTSSPSRRARPSSSSSTSPARRACRRSSPASARSRPQTARRRGLTVDVEAEATRIDGLVDALVAHFR